MFVIDDEMARYLPIASQTEHKLLEADLKLNGGPREPLEVWKEENILIDGHRRFGICSEHGLPFEVKHLSFPDRNAVREYILVKQLQRRNLNDHERAVLTSRLYKEFRKEDFSGAVRKTAATTGQSLATVRRANQYSMLLDKLGPAWSTVAPGLSVPTRILFEISKEDNYSQCEILESTMKEGLGYLKDRYPTKKSRKKPAVTKLPDYIESPFPDTSFEEKLTKGKRIDKLLEEAERASGAFGRACYRLFSEHGMDAAGCMWDNRLAQGRRLCNKVLQEIREDAS